MCSPDQPGKAPPVVGCSLDPLEISVDCSGLNAPWAKERKRVVPALAASSDPLLNRTAQQIALCSTQPFITVDEAGGVYLCPGRCRKRMCPSCQFARSLAVKEKIVSLLGRFNAPKLLTLTMREDHKPLKTRVARLLASFRRLRQQKIWKSDVRSGIAVLEVTPGQSGMGCHVHAHCLIDANFIPQKLLSDAWLKATGDSFVVNIKPVQNREDAAAYVSGYVAKSSSARSWPASRLAELASGLHRVRMVFAFGARVQLDDSLPPEKPKPRISLSCRAVQRRSREGCPLAIDVFRLAGSMPIKIQQAICGVVIKRSGIPERGWRVDEFALAVARLWNMIEEQNTPPFTPQTIPVEELLRSNAAAAPPPIAPSTVRPIQTHHPVLF